LSLTEITLVGGERLRVEGDVHVVESAILSAARGSIMELAWVTTSDTGQRVGLNPDHVLMITAFEPDRP
jgi:F420-0:gamma-glutamyl ligase